MKSLLHIIINGKNRVILDCLMSQTFLEETRNAGLELNFTQSILPTVSNLFANLSANISLDRLNQYYSLLLYFVLSANMNVIFLQSNTLTMIFCFNHLSHFSIFLCGSFSYGPGTLLAQVKGSLKTSRSLRLYLSADLRHSLPSLNCLHTNLELNGASEQSDSFAEG